MFRYVGNSPTNATDPSGHWIVTRTLKDAWAVVDRVEEWSGVTINAPRRSAEGGSFFPYLLDEMTDRRVHGIAKAVSLNQWNPDASTKQMVHVTLGALQYNAKPHLDVAILEITPEVIRYVVGNNHQSPVPDAEMGLLSDRRSPFGQRCTGVEPLGRIVLAPLSPNVHTWIKPERSLLPQYQPDPIDPKKTEVIDYRTFKQHQIRSCWVAAGLSALAFKDPDYVKNMITNNGDGTYTVTLEGGKYTQTVNPSKEKATYTSNGQWAAVIELALIKQYGAKVTKDNIVDPGVIITMLTGSKYRENHDLLGVFGLGDAAESLETLLKRANYKNIVIASTAFHRPGALVRDEASKFLTAEHTYAVLGYDVQQDRVRMRNPHGGEDPKERREQGWGPGEFWLTRREFNKHIVWVAYEN